MKIPVVWLSFKKDTPGRGYWDHGMLEDLFSRQMWQPAGFNYEFVHCTDSIPAQSKGAVIVFPARAQTDMVDKLNNALARLEWVVLMLTGDEEAAFPVEQINHPNIRIYVMSPRKGRHDKYRKLGTGYPPQARRWLKPGGYDDRSLDYFFAGQITHERRQALKQQLDTLEEFKHVNHLSGEYVATEGFTQGLPHEDYYAHLASSKVAPCPSGPETPDSFRLFESLEAGCIPIADTRDPKGQFPDDYWTWFFGEEPPFPVITDYDQLQGFTIEAVANWKWLSNKTFAWWQKKKREFAYLVYQDIYELSGEGEAHRLQDEITVLIPSSPIELHPDTSMIEETIESVRAQLPNSEIIIMLDGVRPEQDHYADRYEDYKRKVLWLCNYEWHNVLPIVHDKHEHQATMAREALKLVNTPTILYVEHDAPPTPDRIIEWHQLLNSIVMGHANVIRLHHEELILPEHEHLMFDDWKTNSLVRTSQWSQRPHLASTAFYRHMLDTYFNPESKTMIEDVMHGIVHSHCEREGLMGWNQWRLWIYCPDTDKLGIKRSYHLDGRGADPKFEMDIKEVRK